MQLEFILEVMLFRFSPDIIVDGLINVRRDVMYYIENKKTCAEEFNLFVKTQL